MAFSDTDVNTLLLKNQNNGTQYLRKCRLIVFKNNGQPDNGIDLSNLRIKFSVKRSDTMTPNTADIRVYNLDETTAKRISNKKEFAQVLLEAGYEENSGLVFQGNIIQVIIGRESATDTFVDLIAGDGDQAYNFAIVNKTLQTATLGDQVKAAVAEMSKKGVTAGHLGEMPPETLPRGKVMFGPAKNYLRNVAQSSDMTWSIQDGKVTFIKTSSYLPGERVVLTSKTGMIGTPQQTNEGLNVKCLLNPKIKIGGRIQVDNKSIARFKIDLTIPNSAANIPAPLTHDGTYYVLVAEHSGDTRGVEWYTTILGINMDVTTNPINAVQVGYG